MKNKLLILLLSNVLFNSCQTKENSYDAFEKVKEYKELGLETYEYKEDSVEIVPALKAIIKPTNEWEKYRSFTYKKIETTQQSINALKISKVEKKNQAKYNKQIAKLEKDNLMLKTQMIQYQKEREDTWEKFKFDIEHQSDVISKELNLLKISKGQEENYLKKIFNSL